MKTPEDEAFDELAKRQGGGFKAKRAMAADKLWDKPSVAFDEWWNGDNDESTNPYRLESGAYWAWAGWKAALAQSAQEPVACIQDLDEAKRKHLVYEKGMDWKDPLYTAPPQRPWIWLSDVDIENVVNTICEYTGSYEEYLIKKAERKIRSMNT